MKLPSQGRRMWYLNEVDWRVEEVMAYATNYPDVVTFESRDGRISHSANLTHAGSGLYEDEQEALAACVEEFKVQMEVEKVKHEAKMRRMCEMLEALRRRVKR